MQAYGLACCEVPPGERLATLTLADIRRLEEASGEPEHRFVEREELDADSVAAYEAARPVYRGLFASGFRFGLKARRGACHFLERSVGCRLPREARPLACRLYPLDFREDGSLTAVEAPQCLALAEADGEQALLSLLGMDRAEVEQLRAQLQKEVAEHAAAMRRSARRG